MRKARWLANWQNSSSKPVIYHCISRVVDRRFVFGERECEAFRMYLRMYENFSGCRVLSYCMMSNHFHLLLEVPPMAEEGLSDGELLKRLSGLYSEAFVAGVAAELEEARRQVSAGVVEEAVVVARIHARFTYRMHDLSEFMKGLLIRFTRWFNRIHSRTGTLWEERFKSVIVESGVAARTMAAYIDLNPLRAGMVEDPADYRWSSYGEAMGGGAKGNGKKAREGLVRAYFCDQGVGFEAEKWREVSRLYRRLMGIELQRKSGHAQVQSRGPVTKNTADLLESADNETALPDLDMAAMLRCRVRYFTDGAVIGSKTFVNEAFELARDRFTSKRKDGARRLRGSGKPAAGLLWSARDLRVGIG
ncbi:MAG: chemotaxis protein CheW [Verrucomicrobiaceae bacterium]|jgi:putative transposase|nr:MAG: chemotaxis protein CheW [Verrucomicrobiaceae bacterium]